MATIKDQHGHNRAGRQYIQIPCCITKYPRRDYIMMNCLNIDKIIDCLWKQNAGFGISFDSYPTNRRFDLMWKELHCVELWGVRQRYRTNNIISFRKGLHDIEGLAQDLGLQLKMVDGDICQTNEVLSKFYQRKSEILSASITRQSKSHSPIPPNALSTEDMHDNTTSSISDLSDYSKKELSKEMTYEKIVSFSMKADKEFERALRNHYNGFHPIGEPLLRDKIWLDLYEDFKTHFPLY